MEVVNYGDVHGDSTESVHAHFGDRQVRHLVLILSARMDGAIASLAAEGHEASLHVVVAPGPVVLVMTACEDVVPFVIVRPPAGAPPIVGDPSTIFPLLMFSMEGKGNHKDIQNLLCHSPTVKAITPSTRVERQDRKAPGAHCAASRQFTRETAVWRKN